MLFYKLFPLFTRLSQVHYFERQYNSYDNWGIYSIVHLRQKSHD